MKKQAAEPGKQRLQFTLRTLFLLQLLVAIVLILTKIAPRSAVEIITLVSAGLYGHWRYRHRGEQAASESNWTRVANWARRFFGATAGAGGGFLIAILCAIFVGQVHSMDEILWHGRFGALLGGVLGLVFPDVCLSIMTIIS